VSSFLLVTQYFPPERGAAQVRLAAVVKQLRRFGHHVEVVTALPNYPTGSIFAGWPRRPLVTRVEDGVRVRRVWVWAAMGSGAGRILNYLSFGIMSLVGLLRSARADWVIVEYPTLLGALPAVVIGRLRRQRVALLVADLWVDSIVEVGALPDGVALRLLRRAEIWMFRRCNAVTAVTEGVRDALLAKGVPPERLRWLPNGADTEQFCPGPCDRTMLRRAGVPDDRAVVLYAGTHGYVHGLEVVVAAAEHLADTAVTFVLVGGGSEKPALQDSVRGRGVTNVVFLDPVAPDEVAALLRCSIAGLATVRSGDLYRTIRSAKMLPTMASGRPVIYSGDDEGSRIVAAAGSGIVCPPGDPVALARAVRQVMEDPDAAGRMGAAGRQWVEQEASWSSLVQAWLGELDGGARVGGR
jgi:colanic acid biosynthesis glycosyl transferase WcaI